MVEALVKKLHPPPRGLAFLAALACCGGLELSLAAYGFGGADCSSLKLGMWLVMFYVAGILERVIAA